ncbi:MAG: 1-deoxy-D-xylulose-5-phosphate reductoisomerase, partial [Kiritimatiellae bacterium]|nr:1-deoxy-D-xylulose-5-phosphate reductoisomerase [Kiritimatiellia bacterium]
LLRRQAGQFGCPATALARRGAAAVEELVSGTDADIVVCAIAGMAALRPALAAIESGKALALASKEIIVAAGSLVCGKARECGTKILPVDSEHSALFRLLGGKGAGADVERLWLTASGGPFLRRSGADPASFTPEMALMHPRWRMGRKVSVDSSTLMNKGFEIIEGSRFFGVPAPRIGVLVHPESVVHALVEMRDGAQTALLAAPDMALSVLQALTWPEPPPQMPQCPRLDLAKAGALHFEKPDTRRFPCLELAREAERRGDRALCAVVAADEVAVDRFLAGDISWPDIPRLVEAVMEKSGGGAAKTGEETLAVYSEGLAAARAWKRAAAHPALPEPSPR